MKRWGPAALLAAASAAAAPVRVLYVTHSAGFRHDSIAVSRQALAQMEGLQVQATEDLSVLHAENLRSYDVLFFFTSGELALSERQKQDLLAFVRDGKGFGGAHSATDTLYGWPEYGDLIGGYFDGHPWVQEATVSIEDPEHPASRHLAPSFRIVEEFYQFRNWSRDRVRVLMTLDTRTIDLGLPGVNRTDGDFALAWVKSYGRGRVFYTALGHFDETWRDPRIAAMIRNALLWLAGELAGETAPRPARPAVAPGGVVNAATFLDGLAPGALVSIFGTALTGGPVQAAAFLPLPLALGGTMVTLNGAPIPLLYASPNQINAQLPYGLPEGPAELAVLNGAPRQVRLQAAAPGIFAVTGDRRPGGSLSIYATGLGAVAPAVAAGAPAPASPLARTVLQPVVTIGGVRAEVRFSGLAPGFAGLYQIDVVVPAGVTAEDSAISVTVPP